MTELYLPPISSPASSSLANAIGPPSDYSHGNFHPHLPGDYTNDIIPAPNLHTHPQQFQGMVPQPRSHSQPLPNILYGPPQPLHNAAYDITQAPPLGIYHPPTGFDVQRFERRMGDAPLAGTYPHQGVAYPPSQRPEPQRLPPRGSSNGPYSLPQGHVLPHDHPRTLNPYPPVVRPQHIHPVPLPHQPYPPVNQVRDHQQVSLPHYTSAPPLYTGQQDQDDPPPRNQSSLVEETNGRLPESKEPARKNARVRKVPMPQSLSPFPKRRGPGRPTKAESDARKKASVEELAAAASLEASSSHVQEPSTSDASRQAANASPIIPGIRPIPFKFNIKKDSPQATPTPQQINTPGNLSSVHPELPDGYKDPGMRSYPFKVASNAIGIPRTTVPLDAPAVMDQGELMALLLIREGREYDLNSYPPIDEPFWPSLNRWTVPPLPKTCYKFNVNEIVDDMISDKLFPDPAERLTEEEIEVVATNYLKVCKS
ncbi:uncharacterized protein EV420DRAFT_1476301 [Desarmillaria tabescens]|uniref:Uncharacterized protein n=1 Tax=Armillaria tabescens TaxID=1929756 RepID=A0AA39NDH6_ARMTA|nr:uncharacterized protein EV420DRAFT_1476301 [Desarmillaria tabescens]KAK0463596.1 hypothetical protein EV420DRAFT_1476301 [Desarmillaria tabescens]